MNTALKYPEQQRAEIDLSLTPAGLGRFLKESIDSLYPLKKLTLTAYNNEFSVDKSEVWFKVVLCSNGAKIMSQSYKLSHRLTLDSLVLLDVFDILNGNVEPQNDGSYIINI